MVFNFENMRNFGDLTVETPQIIGLYGRNLMYLGLAAPSIQCTMILAENLLVKIIIFVVEKEDFQRNKKNMHQKIVVISTIINRFEKCNLQLITIS